ncbi:hypothetical protein C8R43DRAFT_880379 [Mycena crocata]|nr:hypothetical protein C8R43DRAFT_880379 [Mycena crocata]
MEAPPADESRPKSKSKSKIQKEEALFRWFPPPSHWRTPRPSGRLPKIVFNALCITSVGHMDLEPIWAAIRLEEEGKENLWAEHIHQMCDRLNNMLVVASLLWATSAAFITTTPPKESTMSYTLRGPYMCLIGSFGLLLGGIVVATVCALVAGMARPYWAEQVLYTNRLHVYCTIIMLSCPFFFIGVASLLLAFGMNLPYALTPI